MQTARPPALADPAAQSSHEPAWSLEKVPAVQSEQVELPAAANVPAEQATWSDWAAFGTKPALALVQLALPSTAK